MCWFDRTKNGERFTLVISVARLFALLRGQVRRYQNKALKFEPHPESVSGTESGWVLIKNDCMHGHYLKTFCDKHALKETLACMFAEVFFFQQIKKMFCWVRGVQKKKKQSCKTIANLGDMQAIEKISSASTCCRIDYQRNALTRECSSTVAKQSMSMWMQSILPQMSV